jgi:hypothetical protein
MRHKVGNGLDSTITTYREKCGKQRILTTTLLHYQLSLISTSPHLFLDEPAVKLAPDGYHLPLRVGSIL